MVVLVADGRKAGRWFAGMAIGALSMLVPMFNAELVRRQETWRTLLTPPQAPAGIRGSLVALQQLAITFGILISYWIGEPGHHIFEQSDADTKQVTER